MQKTFNRVKEIFNSLQVENLVGSSVLSTEACKMINEDYEAAILQVQHMYLMFVGNLIADKMFLNSVQKTI